MSGRLQIMVVGTGHNQFDISVLGGVRAIRRDCPWLVRDIIQENRILSRIDLDFVIRTIFGEIILRKLESVPNLRNGIWVVTLSRDEQEVRRMFAARRRLWEVPDNRVTG